jgi:branched-chain amino acid aminotransferase
MGAIMLWLPAPPSPEHLTSLRHGEGTFTTFLKINGEAQHWPRHYARLHDAVAFLDLPPLPPQDVLLNTVQQHPDGVIRIQHNRAVQERAFPPISGDGYTLVEHFPPPPPKPPQRLMVVAGWVAANNPLTRYKTTNYLLQLHAKRIAQQQGFDDVLLVNTAGFVSEASTSNVLVVKNGQSFTPPVSDGALPGITRAVMLEAGGIYEQSLTIEDVQKADAVYLINAVQGRVKASLIHQYSH